MCDWGGMDGREFVVITKEPTGQIRDIHDRMPVMLRTDQLEAWLSGEMPIEALEHLEYECTGVPCEEAVKKVETGDKEQMSMF